MISKKWLPFRSLLCNKSSDWLRSIHIIEIINLISYSRYLPYTRLFRPTTGTTHQNFKHNHSFSHMVTEPSGVLTWIVPEFLFGFGAYGSVIQDKTVSVSLILFIVVCKTVPGLLFHTFKLCIFSDHEGQHKVKQPKTAFVCEYNFIFEMNINNNSSDIFVYSMS